MQKLIKKYQQEMLYCLIFVVIYIFSFRKILINYKLSFGHNWDYSFPELKILGQNLVDISLYSWSNYHGENSLLTTHLPHNILYTLLSTFFSQEINIRIVLTISILISFIGVINLADYINSDIKKRSRIKISFLSSILYTFSPYYFSLLIGGSWYAWISYSFAPLFIYNVIRYESDLNSTYENKKYFIGSLVSIIFLIGFLQFFIISIAIVLLLLNIKIKKTKIVLLILSSILILSYCILPIVLSYKNIIVNLVNNESLYNQFEAVLTSRHDIYSIITGVGFLNRNFYIEANYFPLNVAFYLYSLAIFYILLIPLLSRTNNNLYIHVCLFIVFLIILVKGGNYPFPSITMFLYESLTIMKIYRSPQNLFWGITICSTILLIISLGIIYKANIRTFNKITTTLFLCAPFYLSSWIINGDIGTKELIKKNMSSIHHYKIEKAIEEMFIYSENIDSNQFELYIPFANSVEFLSNLNTKYNHQGGEPNYQYLKNISPIMRIANEDLFSKTFNNKYYLAEFLEKNAIGYIIIRKDIKSHFFKNNTINHNELEKTLEFCCIKIFSTDTFTRYKVKENFHNRIVNAKRQGTIIKYNHLVNKDSQESNIKINQISPVEYRISFRNLSLKDNINIQLNLPYSKNWKIGLAEGKNYYLSVLDLFFPKKIIEQHSRVNSHPYDLNNWSFNVENIILNNSSLHNKNLYGKYDIEILIYHSLQKYYYYGIISSIISIIILFVLCVFKFKNNE